MNIDKAEILNNICYTELVYGRINKKLQSEYSRLEIEKMISKIIEETETKHFYKVGKNIYVENSQNSIKITINSNTYRVITVDKI